MTLYTFGLKKQFAIEFERFPKDQQDKILDFTDIFEAEGLTDFSKYTGKITPSWAGDSTPAASKHYAFANDLWHYHIGIPHYASVHPKYMTSDWVLHFQWPNQGNHIDIVDVYSHYKSDGSFYLPPVSSLL
jgi:hypothetical protein